MKFRLCEHSIPCGLEKNKSGGFRQGHMEPCPSNTTNIMSELLPCICLKNLVGRWLFDHIALRDLVADQNHYNSTNREALATKLCSMVICIDELLPIILHDFFTTLSCEITWQTKTIRSELLQCLSVAPKNGSVMTYHEGLWTIKSNNALITWSYKVTWETKTIISSLTQYLWPTNLAEW